MVVKAESLNTLLFAFQRYGDAVTGALSLQLSLVPGSVMACLLGQALGERSSFGVHFQLHCALQSSLDFGCSAWGSVCAPVALEEAT